MRHDKKQVVANFINPENSIMTYDREALVCNAPAWRYVYHTIHSSDKWFFDPFVYDEPEFHEEGMDDPDNACSAVLSDELLLDHLHKVKQKTVDYLDEIDDSILNEHPKNCKYTRLELVLMQFGHISMHTGMLNGQTIERTGRFPAYVGPDTMYRLENGYYDE